MSAAVMEQDRRCASPVTVDAAQSRIETAESVEDVQSAYVMLKDRYANLPELLRVVC